MGQIQQGGGSPLHRADGQPTDRLVTRPTEITTRGQALQVLQHPVFADPLCCEAVAWLEAFEELATLRELNHLGRKYECPCCNGTGETLCDHCGNFCECHTCEGKGSWTTIQEWEQGVYLKCLEQGTLQTLRSRIAEIKHLLDA